MMRLSEPILDMEMANYSEVLDPTYTALEFETMQILCNGNGELGSAVPKPARGQGKGGNSLVRPWGGSQMV